MKQNHTKLLQNLQKAITRRLLAKLNYSIIDIYISFSIAICNSFVYK